MSLSSQLRSGESPLSVWLRRRLPHLPALAAAWEGRLPAGRTTVGWPRPAGPVPWPLLGMAIDHRLRFALVDPRGAQLEVCWNGARGASIGNRFVDELKAWTFDIAERLRPADRDGPVLLQPDAEDELSRLCVVLSWVEAVFREGLPTGEDPLTRTPLRAGRPPPAPGELARLVPPGAVEDLGAVVTLAQRSVFARLRSTTREGEVTVGPTFLGSADVGGADADWLARGTLLDCKSTVRPSSVGDHGLYQLACYPLLDYDDRRNITGVGIYLARQGQLVTWPLLEVLSLLAGGPVDLVELRQDLRRHLRTG